MIQYNTTLQPLQPLQIATRNPQTANNHIKCNHPHTKWKTIWIWIFLRH